MIREILPCGCVIDGRKNILEPCFIHVEDEVADVFSTIEDESTEDHLDVTVPEAP